MYLNVDVFEKVGNFSLLLAISAVAHYVSEGGGQNKPNLRNTCLKFSDKKILYTI